MKVLRFFVVFIFFIALFSVSYSQEIEPQKAIISVERIWDRALGGPNFIRLSNGTLLCGTWDYREEGNRKTMLAKITSQGEFLPILVLPSGGDTSYPGLVVFNDLLYVSYYSSHQEKTAIYLAKIWFDRIN